MDPSFRESLERLGAVFEGDEPYPSDFGDPQAELRSAFDGCVLADRSDLCRLEATGPDILDLLHRLSTADLRSLSAGEGKTTVLTSPRGRIVQRLFVHHLGDRGVLMVGGPGDGTEVVEHLARYTFAENTGLSVVTRETCQLVLIGPRAGEALERSGLRKPCVNRVESAELAGTAVNVLGQDGLATDGFSVIARIGSAAEVWTALVDGLAAVGGRPTGRSVLESYRILRGLPAAGHELTEEHNPLEAGLRDAVDFDKGCYVGQEVVARLRTYDKVARSIVGLELSTGREIPAVGSKLFHDDRVVGQLTSAALPPGRTRPVALGYVKRKEIRPGLELRVGDANSEVTARLVDLPFER